MMTILEKSSDILFENFGYCFCCDSYTRFIAKDSWFRDSYICENCNSIPRERAIMYCLEKFSKDWRNKVIHESSPSPRGASVRISKEAKKYIPTQYFPNIKTGNYHKKIRCEDLSKLTFKDNSIDIHITQDVLEHVFNPSQVFKEISRTLKKDGLHIFTVPLVNKNKKSEECAIKESDGSIKYLIEPTYHGNPISDSGSLVTMNWGYDITNFIFNASGLFTEIIFIDAIDFGIRADLIEVLITRK